MAEESETTVQFRVALGGEFSEDDVWQQRVKPLLVGWPENVIRLCNYGFTEMLNNANDHSGAQYAVVTIKIAGGSVGLHISDDGVGIFTHIYRRLGLEDERHAVFELTKGKVTTDPERHSGEGIFFTSRMCDNFAILSGELFLGRSEERDWLLERSREADRKGTFINMEINRGTNRTTKEVFDRYCSRDEDDYGFKKTIVAVGLADQGDVLLSRSQAKRVMGRLDRFSDVFLDFEGIAEIGPAFADEIFRVFQKAHPEIRIVETNANESVKNMISKARADAAQASPPAQLPLIKD